MINEIVCMFFKIEIFILACIQIRAKSNDGKMNLNNEIIKLAGKTYITLAYARWARNKVYPLKP